MHRLSCAVLALGLAACVAQTAGPPPGQYRPPKAAIYSSAVLDQSRLPGRWKQVAGFGPAAACAPGGVDITPGLTAAFRLCQSGGEVAGSGAMTPIGPGRFRIAGQDWWVLWADGDYRTLVIGTPSGAFGYVLNRGGAISADRMKAARDILDWNGYDLRQFQPL